MGRHPCDRSEFVRRRHELRWRRLRGRHEAGVDRVEDLHRKRHHAVAQREWHDDQIAVQWCDHRQERQRVDTGPVRIERSADRGQWSGRSDNCECRAVADPERQHGSGEYRRQLVFRNRPLRSVGANRCSSCPHTGNHRQRVGHVGAQHVRGRLSGRRAVHRLGRWQAARRHVHHDRVTRGRRQPDFHHQG